MISLSKTAFMESLKKSWKSWIAIKLRSSNLSPSGLSSNSKELTVTKSRRLLFLVVMLNT